MPSPLPCYGPLTSSWTQAEAELTAVKATVAAGSADAGEEDDEGDEPPELVAVGEEDEVVDDEIGVPSAFAVTSPAAVGEGRLGAEGVESKGQVKKRSIAYMDPSATCGFLKSCLC